MEQSLTRPAPSLPPIVEGEILAPEDFVNIDEGAAKALGSPHDVDSAETTPLVRSGTSFSYTEGTRDGEDDIFDDEDGDEDYDDNVSVIRDRFGSSIMTEFQASLFLPSVQVSLHSTLRGYSTEFGVKSVTASQAQKQPYQTVSSYHSKSVLITLVEKLSDDRGSSFFLTIWNILPSLLGSALFAMPYVVAKGGHLILIPLFVICLLADYTGKLLIECLYEISPRSKTNKRVRLDIVDVADSVMGIHGARTVNFLMVFYLTAVDIVNLVLLGDSVFAIVQPYTTLSHKVITTIAALFVIPTLFIRRLSTLAYLSMLSVLSIIAGGLAIVVIFFQHNSEWAKNATAISLWEPEGSLLALSMILYTIIAHPVLAQIEGSMREPKRFHSALHISYVSSTLIKIFVGILGGLTFGLATKPIVSLNVSVFSQAVSIVCSVALIGYAVFSFPLNLFVVCELFDLVTVANRYPSLKKDGKYHFLWLLASRPVLVGLCLAIALVVPYFNYLVGIVGSLIGTTLVFILPCVFHVVLKKKKISKAQFAGNILLIIFGTICGFVGLYAAVRGLITAMMGGDTN